MQFDHARAGASSGSLKQGSGRCISAALLRTAGNVVCEEAEFKERHVRRAGAFTVPENVVIGTTMMDSVHRNERGPEGWPGDRVGDVTEIWEPSAGIGTQQWEAPSKNKPRAGATCTQQGGMQRARAPSHGRRRARWKRAQSEGWRRRHCRDLGAVRTQERRTDAPSKKTRTEKRPSCVRDSMVTRCHDVREEQRRPDGRWCGCGCLKTADSQWLVCLRPGARKERDEGKKKEPTRSRQNKPP
ncbi:hypothetical protein GGX14DRAFT_679048 [Mycena pura]|uniref:Uncharacterized protein n=1 Tax=Mycena pura TaxID=153505 RepID=A0AAD6UVD5_9AGAR|nr:hypothetical protein GGX14DRAFT_679048 [Mycena pura]